MRIWAFHLFNDYSGSPLMLKNALKAIESSAEIHLWTSKSEGFLSDAKVHQFHPNSYRWKSGKLGLLFNLIRAQWEAFMLIYKNRKSIDALYLNTLLPAGAALAGKLCSIPVIYHLHEPQLNNRLLFHLLKATAIWTADKAIFVSNYLQSCFPELAEKGEVIPNVLSEGFLKAIKHSEKREREGVLMLCSYKAYKGIEDFAGLAENDGERSYTLILNSSEDQIAEFREKHKALKNLSILSSPADLHPYYQKAALLLNLSHPDKWIESFGMTALEAMAYGLPCIVPEIGGIADLVTEECGFKTSVFKPEKISRQIDFLFSDERIYAEYSLSALQRSRDYSFQTFKEKLCAFFGLPQSQAIPS